MSAPAWMKKHPCGACGTGYGMCAQTLTMGLQCCKGCNHPTRWTDDPYTAADIVEMWEGQEMPPHVKETLERLARTTVVHIDPPKPPRAPHPCEVGRHRWAWLVDGRQACGYCGRPR